MGFAEALEGERSVSGHPQCRTCRALLIMGEQDVADFNSALDDPGVSSTMISKALGKIGVVVSPDSVQKHRKWHR